MLKNEVTDEDGTRLLTSHELEMVAGGVRLQQYTLEVSEAGYFDNNGDGQYDSGDEFTPAGSEYQFETEEAMWTAMAKWQPLATS